MPDTALSSASGGFSFSGRSSPSQAWGSPFSEDAPLSSFMSPQPFSFNDSASSMGGRRGSTATAPSASTPERRGSASRAAAPRPTSPATPAASAPPHPGSSAAEASESTATAPDGPQPPPDSWANSPTPAHLVPSTMDAASYAAGERSALLKAFREALPAQQTLGALQSSVTQVQRDVGEEAGRVRLLQSDAAELRASVKGVTERLHALETGRLSGLEQRMEAVAAAGPSQEFQQTLAALQEVLAGLAAQRGGGGGGGGGGFLSPPAPATVSGAVTGYAASLGWGVVHAARSAVAASDGAAVAIARRLLLDQGAAKPAKGGAWPQQGGPRLSEPQSSAAADPARAVLGAALLVAAVELAADAQRRAAAVAPRALNRAAAPLGVGLRTARVAVWAAALLLSAARVRRACLDAAAYAVAAARRSGAARAAAKATNMVRRDAATAAEELAKAAEGAAAAAKEAAAEADAGEWVPPETGDGGGGTNGDVASSAASL